MPLIHWLDANHEERSGFADDGRKHYREKKNPQEKTTELVLCRPGYITDGEWCYLEAARINHHGGEAEVERRKGDNRLIRVLVTREMEPDDKGAPYRGVRGNAPARGIMSGSVSNRKGISFLEANQMVNDAMREHWGRR